MIVRTDQRTARRIALEWMVAVAIFLAMMAFGATMWIVSGMPSLYCRLMDRCEDIVASALSPAVRAIHWLNSRPFHVEERASARKLL